MKILNYSLLLAIVLSISSCSAIGGIFKAGVWVGIILVALVVGIILFFFSKGKKS